MTLKDRITRPSEAWRPADNDQHPNPLCGRVLDVEVGIGDYGEYPIVFVDDGEAEWRVHGFGSVLKKRIATLAPAAGDEIAFYYAGEEPAKAYPGKFYRNFRVQLERANGNTAKAPDWEAMAKAAEAEASEPF